ncbi:44895_t:CDS:2 [Gigaspora margarita]|uniref:44895_t:CDS:1 n=1 Tax=Gigaspora margarita TaxID=4874 RepID=A0ABN7VBW6_GIGMA|nr:44895_t:CDS:2 [Gigaspora margarita]
MVAKAVEKMHFREEKDEKLQKRKLMIQGIIPVSLEKETLEERRLKNQTFKALNKGFYEVIWRLKCEAVAEKKRKKIPETGNENEEEEIKQSKKRQRTKKSNKKNNIASGQSRESSLKFIVRLKKLCING